MEVIEKYIDYEVIVILFIVVVLWIHFYFLPQYLIDRLQCFFSSQQVIYCFRLTNQNTADRTVVALTIDDSPTDNTPAILDFLKLHGLKCTFFIISSQVIGREHIMKRIVDEGHELGNHSDTDCFNFLLSPSEFERSLRICESKIMNYVSNYNDASNIKWFRPGRALFNSSMLKTLNIHSYRLALANVYPHDANGLIKFQSNFPLLNAWYLRHRVRSGAIIVLHDRPWTTATMELAVPSLLASFQFTTLSNASQYYEKLA